MEIIYENENGERVPAEWRMENGTMIVSPMTCKFEPRDGDVCRSPSCIYIFKKTNERNAAVYHCCLIVGPDILKIEESVGVGHIDYYHRYATEEEKKALFDKIDQEGYEWLADKKKLVKKKWMPEYEEKYYYPYFDISENVFIKQYAAWTGIYSEKNGLKKGWIFRTEEECQQFCDKLNQAINSIKP